MPHGNVAGEAAEGLAQRGDESSLAARCGVASHPVMAVALPRGSDAQASVADKKTSELAKRCGELAGRLRRDEDAEHRFSAVLA